MKQFKILILLLAVILIFNTGIITAIQNMEEQTLELDSSTQNQDSVEGQVPELDDSTQNQNLTDEQATEVEDFNKNQNAVNAEITPSDFVMPNCLSNYQTVTGSGATCGVTNLRSPIDNSVVRGAMYRLLSDGTLEIGPGYINNLTYSEMYDMGGPVWGRFNTTINSQAKRVVFIDPENTYLINSFGLFMDLVNVEEIIGLENVQTTGLNDTSGNLIRPFNNTAFMFHNMNSLKKLDLSSWDTSKITTMISMFGRTHSMNELNLSNWNTGNVTRMNQMFWQANSLENLSLSHFDTSNVTTMVNMFRDMANLQTLDLSGWNNTATMNMSLLIAEVPNLKTVNLTDFKTPNVTDMSWMFFGAQSLSSLDVSSFDTSKVTTINDMFAYTNNLSTLILGHDFSFVGGNASNLPNITETDVYTGSWINNNPISRSEIVLNSTDLMTTYDGNTMAGTYVWQRKPSPYSISAVDFTINIEEVDTVDILMLSKAMAINENDVSEVVTPLIKTSNLKKEVGTHDVIIGIDKDDAVEHTIKVSVIDNKDKTIVDEKTIDDLPTTGSDLASIALILISLSIVSSVMYLQRKKYKS